MLSSLCEIGRKSFNFLASSSVEEDDIKAFFLVWAVLLPSGFRFRLRENELGSSTTSDGNSSICLADESTTLVGTLCPFSPSMLRLGASRTNGGNALEVEDNRGVLSCLFGVNNIV